MTEKRIFGLDVIRAAAILMVVFSHSVIILASLIPLRFVGPVVGKVIAMSFPFGVFGVELFFALSGFLIGGILFKIHNSDEGFTVKGLGKFWSRRWFRTLPAYYIMLLINFIVWKHFDFHYLLFTQNLDGPIPDFFVESWSLSIEEWSYLLFPMILFICNYLIPTIPKKKLYISLIIIYIVASWLIKILYIGHLDTHNSNYWEQYIRPVVVLRLDAILYGILLSYLWQEHNAFLVRYAKIMFAVGMTGLVLSYIYMILGSKPFYFSVKYAWHRVYGDFFFLAFVNFFSVLLIPRLINASFEWWETVKKSVVYVSTASYSMYLLHFSFLFLFLFHQEKAHALSYISSVFIFILFWAATLVGSYYMHWLVEKPFMILRDRIVKK